MSWSTRRSSATHQSWHRQPAPPSPFLVTLRCRGKDHRVHFTEGRLTFLDHPVEDLNFELAMQKTTLSRCARFLAAIRAARATGRFGTIVPAPIQTAITNRWNRRLDQGHGDRRQDTRETFQNTILAQRAERLSRPVLHALMCEGFQVTHTLDSDALEHHRFLVQIAADKTLLLSLEGWPGHWQAPDPPLLKEAIYENAALFGNAWECNLCKLGTGLRSDRRRLTHHFTTPRHYRKAVAAFKRVTHSLDTLWSGVPCTNPIFRCPDIDETST
jgi:hypothetical protein